MSRVIPLPLKRVAERQQISPTCLLSFLNLLYHESFYRSPYSLSWKIVHFFSFLADFAPCAGEALETLQRADKHPPCLKVATSSSIFDAFIGI